MDDLAEYCIDTILMGMNPDTIPTFILQLDRLSPSTHTPRWIKRIMESDMLCVTSEFARYESLKSIINYRAMAKEIKEEETIFLDEIVENQKLVKIVIFG